MPDSEGSCRSPSDLLPCLTLELDPWVDLGSRWKPGVHSDVTPFESVRNSEGLQALSTRALRGRREVRGLQELQSTFALQ